MFLIHQPRVLQSFLILRRPIFPSFLLRQPSVLPLSLLRQPSVFPLSLLRRPSVIPLLQFLILRRYHWTPPFRAQSSQFSPVLMMPGRPSGTLTDAAGRNLLERQPFKVGLTVSCAVRSPPVVARRDIRAAIKTTNVQLPSLPRRESPLLVHLSQHRSHGATFL